MNVKRWEGDFRWVEIDLDRCNGAGDCAADCPAEVYAISNGKVSAEAIGDCVECGECEGLCHNNAILRHSAWK